jgi:transcriptional regulator with XRE-family HTH domain
VNLRAFVLELHKKQGLSQTEIARRSELSQGLIYKILAGIGTSQMRTYQKLASSFPDEWSDYLRRHPGFRRELGDAFGWATNSTRPGTSRPGDASELFLVSLGLDQPSELPPEAQERYRQRVREMMDRTVRELKEYSRTLEKELKRPGNRRGK